jgi:hypothetical protein
MGRYLDMVDNVKPNALTGEPILSGPNDAEKEGRWIRTTAAAQYGATRARWFGAGPTELAAVFPNLTRLAPADLGFLG